MSVAVQPGDISKARSFLDSLAGDPRSIPAYSHVLTSDVSQNIRQHAAIEMRKSISEGDLWSKVPQSDRDQIKAKLLELILSDGLSTPTSHAVAPLISGIASAENNLDAWPQLIPFVNQVTSKTVTHREVAVYLLFKLSSDVQNSHKYCQSLLAPFQKLLLDPENNDVKVTAVCALGAIASRIGPSDHADISAIQSLFPTVLRVIDQIVEAGNLAGARQLFDVLDKLLVLETPIVNPRIAELCNFLMIHTRNISLKSDMRIMALERLDSTIRSKRSLILSHNLMPGILEGLMSISAEVEGTNDANPPCRVAQGVINSLSVSLPPNQVFPTLRTFTQQYISSPDPNKRRGAMGALGSSVEGCSELMGSSMSQVWSDVEAGLRDPDVSVRKAAFTTVGRLCGWLQDACRAKHATLVPALLGGLNNPVTQSEACSALASLLEVIKPVIDQYLALVMAPLSLLLQTAPSTLKPTVVNAIGSAAHASDEKFLPYFTGIMPWFRYFLLHFSHDHELRTAVITSVGRLAQAVGGNVFRPYLPEISGGALEGIKNGNENVSKGCSVFIETAIRMYGKEFVAQQPDLVKIMLAKSRIQTNDGQASSESNEAAIDAIGSLAVAAPTSFSPFVEQSTSQLVASLSDPYDGTRKASTDALFKIIISSYELGNGQQFKPGMNIVPLSPALKDLVGRTLPPVLDIFKVEDNKGVISGLCVGLAGAINKIGPALIEGHEDAIRGICTQILEQKALCQRDPGQDANANPPKYLSEYDSALISSAGTLVASLASAFGVRFANSFSTYFPLIANYYDKGRSLTDRSCSVGCLGDIIKGMKSAITPWAGSLMELFLRALGDEAAGVRSNAAFAMGQLMENCGSDLSTHYHEVFNAIHPLFTISPGEPTRDNAVGAVARLIIRNTAAVPLDRALPAIMESLPIKNDYTENAPVFRALCQLHRTQPQILRPYHDKMLHILASVLGPQGAGQVGGETRAELIQLLTALMAEEPGKFSALSHLVTG